MSAGPEADAGREDAFARLVDEAAQTEVARQAATRAADDAFWAYWAVCRERGSDDCHGRYDDAVRERERQARSAAGAEGGGG